jgi:serine/threonine protein kinase/Flp pilus assembly protein TadD
LNQATANLEEHLSPAMPVVRADAARRLWQLWQEGQQPDLASFLAQGGPLEPLELAAVLRVDQWQRRLIGQRIPAECYLQMYPDVAADPEAALDVVYAEFLHCKKRGENISPQEFVRRFPQFADQLQLQLNLGQALAGPGTELPCPESTVLDVQPEHAIAEKPHLQGFRLLRTLGRGGMGIVYAAQQLNPPRQVALKMILSPESPAPDRLARFQAEAEAIARVNHLNIVQIYEIGEHQGRPFLSLELVDGVDLAQKHARTLPSPLEAAQLVETLARAMHHAHERGLIHRDLKPENVLIRVDGIPKITDFGLARFLDSTSPLTRTNDLLGTPAYMSPEQASGQAHNVGPACDIYGLGGILYYLLTGLPPFPGESVLQVLDQVRTHEPVPPRRSNLGCAPDLEIICLKCLRKEPNKRYTSAEELAEELRLFRQGKPIRARPTPTWERILKWCRRRPAAAALLGTITVLVVLTTVGLTVAKVRAWQRLCEVRHDAQTALLAGRDAAERKQWSESELHLDNVLKSTATEPSLLDLHTRAEKLQEAYAKLRRFMQQRDEALFRGVYIALFPGQESEAPIFPAEVSEELTSCLSERQRTELAQSRYEMLLVQADIEARSAGTAPERAQRALARLDQAATFSGDRHGYHLRRAYYLSLQKADQEMKREAALLENSPPVSALDHFLSGIHQYQQAELERAVHSFETALRLQPDHFWSQFFLAACQLRSRNWLAAQYSLNSCRLQRPDFAWTLLLRGFAQVELAKYRGAEDDFQQAESILDRNPGGQNSVFARQAYAALEVYCGILFVRQGQLSKAIEHFEAAIRRQPTLYQAHVGLLWVYLEQDQLHEADKRFSEFAALNPPAVVVADYHTQRARRLSLHGRYREAVDACHTALAARQDHTEVYALMGLALLHLEDYRKAADALDRYLELKGQPLPDIYRGRGHARMQLGRFKDAREDYSRALELTTKPGANGLARPAAELLTHRGWAWFFMNDFEPALLDFEQALQGLPGSSDAIIGCGLCKAMLARYREAIADAQAALRLHVNTPEMMFNVACIYSLAFGEVRADAPLGGKPNPDTQYRTVAVACIRSALEMLPLHQRSLFWETKMRADRALDPIRSSAAFAQLEKDFSTPRPELPGPQPYSSREK